MRMLFKRMRKDYYVDPKLQFRYISISLFSTFVNLSIFILWMVGANIISSLAVGDMEMMLLKYGGTVLVILAIISLSMFIGMKISNHIAGPIYKFSQKAREIKKGIIASEVFLREHDEFVGFQGDFNDMMEGLEAIVRKDRTKIKEINQKLDNLVASISKIKEEQSKSSLLEIKQEIQGLTQGFVLTEYAQE